MTDIQYNELKQQQTILHQIADRTYNGTDLTIKFADEIKNFTDEWQWIKSRIQSANWDGIWVGDFIPFTTTNGYTFHAEIAGIDTYYRYGDILVSHHIDFICRELWPEKHTFNSVDYNNGTSINGVPWIASDLYAWLNGLPQEKDDPKPKVPTNINGTVSEFDYGQNSATQGVWHKLPQKLKSVIVQKRIFLGQRYTTGQVLTDDNWFTWAYIGQLWVPSEVEVSGRTIWGTMTPTNQGWSRMGYQQYPIFACDMKRVKFPVGVDETVGKRASWWLSTATGGRNNRSIFVGDYGSIHEWLTSSTEIYAPICFRVMQIGNQHTICGG